jgi:hypothetical protein
MSRALANALHLAKLAQVEERTDRRRRAEAAKCAPIVLRPLVRDDAVIRNEVLDLFPPTARRLACADPRER